MSDRQDERRPKTSLQARREDPTSGKKAWLITGAGRGMGVDISKAALAAGNAVVATGRNIDVASLALGQAENLLVVKLDVTSSADAEAAVKAAVDRFGHIDVLVNNAANFYGGYFEELTPEQIERQLATGLIGPMNVTRAVLPVMRKQCPVPDIINTAPRRGIGSNGQQKEEVYARVQTQGGAGKHAA